MAAAVPGAVAAERAAAHPGRPAVTAVRYEDAPVLAAFVQAARLMGGLDVLPVLRKDLPGIPVVMLTTSNDESDLIKALRTGAQGYLLKDMEPDELVGALRDIENGKNVVAADLTDALARMVQGETTVDDDDGPFAELTPRETEILCLLAEGQSNKLIARNLGISDGTVKLHVKAILRKLNIHSRVEAAVMAVEHGLRNKD